MAGRPSTIRVRAVLVSGKWASVGFGVGPSQDWGVCTVLLRNFPHYYKHQMYSNTIAECARQTCILPNNVIALMHPSCSVSRPRERKRPCFAALYVARTLLASCNASRKCVASIMYATIAGLL
jgi:hypothetical protein